MDDATDARQLASQVDKLLGRLDAMLDLFERPSGTNQTVQNSTHFGGFAAGVCVATGVASLVLVIVVTIFGNFTMAAMGNDVRDTKAWNEVLRAKVAKLEAQQPQTEKK